MTGCPRVHEHPEFGKSLNHRNTRQQKLLKKFKRLLISDSGHDFGEYKKGDLSPFKSYPRGNNPIRFLFILCKDCDREVIRPACEVCGTNIHSTNDAVLFFAGEHDDAYSRGKRIINQYKSS